MGVFCDRIKLGSTVALDCQTGQNKGRYRKKELLFLLVSLTLGKDTFYPLDSMSRDKVWGNRTNESLALADKVTHYTLLLGKLGLLRT